MLMCQYLSSVRMAEHTVSTLVVDKFVSGMEELRDILGKFGSSLLLMEHVRIFICAKKVHEIKFSISFVLESRFNGCLFKYRLFVG